VALKPNPSESATEAVDWLGVLRQHVNPIRFGVVQIVVHDTRVVQVDRREETRFDARKASNHGSAGSESETERQRWDD